MLFIKNNKKVFYYHVDHKLRNNSSSEARKLKALLLKYSINCKILSWNGKTQIKYSMSSEKISINC